jgi:predicted nucleotidyltransferase
LDGEAGRVNKHQDTIGEFCAALNKAGPSEPPSVILIGSVARNSETPRSDVDLLIIGAQKLKTCSAPSNFHLHITTAQDFLRKLRNGDDLAAWCVRFGVSIQDAGIWREIRGSAEAQTWPDWRKKILHATRRLVLAKTLLETGDIDAASEEVLYAASHAARAVLLKSKIFPLARAELISQTRNIGHERLAQMLETFLFGVPDEKTVEGSAQYLKKIFIDLDESEFKRWSQEFSRMAPLSRKPAGLADGSSK